MADITLADVELAVKTTATTVLNNEHYFSDLDGLAGDGDFGTSLATGFRVIDADLPTIDKSAIGAMLLKISMLVSKHVGGSSGPIWGTGFMKAAAISKGKQSVTLAEVADMLGAAIDGIMARGGAKLGDKTLLDALIPVHEALKAHAAAAEPDNKAALKDAADAAEAAIDATRSLVAHRGRASQVGERSANTPDPGIVAIATILQAWCGAFGVERTATVAEVVKAA
ncbi:dihydroxyacetone kinase subunit DhaL [Sphingomonas sp. MMS24-J13]|uniref:dihydroxyacetone kinase subunit DhaL n=1 Tax=Sphingomonas sp. MMS24-J13 TaxID=3238686 RepID=UPI003850BA53